VNNRAADSFDFNRLACFYRSEYNYLVATGLYRGFELEQVKDIIHQLFLDFAEKKIDLENIRNVRAYIVTSFKRRLIDSHRMNVKRINGDSLIYRELSELSIDKAIEENENSHEKASKLRKAYEKLPERCKKVIFLKYYEGLNNEEIKKRTGLSIRSIYNNLSEGTRQLREEVMQHHIKRGKIATFQFLLLLLFCLF
jgi:RNA polymerase sigma factor (sigma-70 family)